MSAALKSWLAREQAQPMLTPVAPCDASELARSRDPALEALLHLFMLNRGILITPFHSMLLMCPATQSQDIERFLGAFAQFCTELRGSLRCRS